MPETMEACASLVRSFFPLVNICEPKDLREPGSHLDQYMRFSGLQVPEAMDAFETFTAGLIPHVEVPYEEE